jgi:hypothetical protein
VITNCACVYGNVCTVMRELMRELMRPRTVMRELMRPRAVIQSHNLIWIWSPQLYKELHPLNIVRRKSAGQDTSGSSGLARGDANKPVSACTPGLYWHNWNISVFFGSLWPRRSGEQLLRCKSHQHSESVECRGVRRGAGSGPRGAGGGRRGRGVVLEGGEWSIRNLQASRNVMTGLG